MIENIEFLHFFTATCLVEVLFLYLFRFTRSPLTGKAINNWYTHLGWSAVILDIYIRIDWILSCQIHI